MTTYKTQSIIFDATKWTIIDSANWLLNNDFDVIEIDETENYIGFGAIYAQRAIIFKQIDASVLKQLGYTVYKKVRLAKSGIEMIQVFKPIAHEGVYAS